ncbi:TPA: hypothetical protein N2D99_001989 [Clostridium botulinum]|nr:hypothetical protein [Clostridium botulinum]
MEKRINVVQKGAGFVIKVRFIEKDKVLVTESEEIFSNRSKANSMALTWSKIYGTKLEV